MYVEILQGNEDPEKWSEQKFIYLLDKEIIHLRRNDEAKGLGLGAVNYGEETKRYGGGTLGGR